MPTLDPGLRDQLARVIGAENQDDGARTIAEVGARAAIHALAVHRPAPHGTLDAGSKQLRTRLRARARQLGDERTADGSHATTRLVEQTAYEHWHRMLFARFLAENDLLIHPVMNVSVTLEECAELASSEGAADAWELAGRYASRMLPQIFRPDDPVLAVTLAPEHQRELESLLASLPSAVFKASDSLGWCYQFWQARKKGDVNASEVKIGADELPSVTQLFTEPYMVQFLLHNTLGAWWVGAGRKLPLDLPYLRLLDDGSPVAGRFEGWPRLARELKVLDPCCGSGHFLVGAFEVLVAFRMAEDGLGAREACDAVLHENLFGLEIDYRCVQIAAFALALAAWTYPSAGGYRLIASMNLACSGLAISAKKADWENLAGEGARLRNGMGRMWELFKNAPFLGSLIDPVHQIQASIEAAGFHELRDIASQALERERTGPDADVHEMRIVARGLSLAGELLGGRYHLVATNVPYLARGKQGEVLADFSEAWFSVAKTDLATTFVRRADAWLAEGGALAVVFPQNSLDQSYYKRFRGWILENMSLCLLAQLGAGAFDTIGGEVVKPALLTATRGSAAAGHTFFGVNAVLAEAARGKAEALRLGDLLTRSQEAQYKNAQHRIHLGETSRAQTLASFLDYQQGICTGDLARFGRKFWELPAVGGKWARQQTTVSSTRLYGGLENILLWEGGQGELYSFVSERLGDARVKSWLRGESAWGKQGIAVSSTGSISTALYTGELYDDSTMVLTPKKPEYLLPAWAFCSSPDYGAEVRKIEQSLKLRGVLIQVPFDYARWKSEAERLYPNGLPTPQSGDPTQWVFSGDPRASDAPLHAAVARLVGYRWPDQPADSLDAHADSDGIVCIPAVRGERVAADRLVDLIAAAWGTGWHSHQVTALLVAAGHDGNLEDWLRNAFFKQHCELFQQRPFIWHVWDGHREGFSALVNYHKLDHENLKSLTYTYLGDWIRTQEVEAKAGKSGAPDKLAKAKALQQRLGAILDGDTPLDIFVRWKTLEQQPIGWQPDLDDGVRINIRPFLTAPDVGAKGAGVLRWRPNIKWGKDKGKNPPGCPWGEDRENDEHLSLVEKRAARGSL